MYAIIGPGKLYGIGDSSFIARRQPNGVELRRGIAKGVRIVRDDHGAVIPAVVLDCTFYRNFINLQNWYSLF